MKKGKILLSFCLAVMLGLSVSAQDKTRKGPEERAERMTKMMTEKLQLTEEQQKEVHEVNMEMAKASMENREEMKGTMEKHDEQMKDILNEEQYAMYKENKAKKGAHMKKDRSRMRMQKDE